MNIEQFELILCDMYTMDAWSPPLLWKWKKEFKEASTKQWAISELENYIRKRLHRLTRAHSPLSCAMDK